MCAAPVCSVCGAQESVPRYQVGAYAIRQCAACTHGFVDPMPTDAELAAIYRDQEEDSLLGNGLSRQLADYLDAAAGRFASFYGYRLDAIRRAGVPKTARVLDYGCAIGAFVKALALEGWKRSSGYDVAEHIVAEGRRRWGLDLHAGSREAYFADSAGQFGLVHSANVFEHLRAPTATLDELGRLLVPGGHVVVSVPNLRSVTVALAGKRSPWIAPPHHLQYFTPRSLATLLERGGFEVRHLSTPFWTSDSDIYLHMLGVPLPIGRGLRHVMGVPGAIIRGSGRGGIISALATRRT
jgi:2-polyprenyl-3-methyl-5-hydroxy-6-metoxy-1,4-benzoquinol methylase